ncbi:MAG: DUF3306 domain-containing protein, partial [Gammaproteobacteria bacterium]|nr:DUF3306 domain-containing protein [Gammaproteobacteria bacterium]
DDFLTRWSRRKLEGDEKSELEKSISNQPEVEPPTSDHESLPVWQQKDADPDIKRQALSTLFRQPQFNELDGLNEYDEDYTSFSSLGNVVTQEMKRMLRLAEEKTRPEDVTPNNDVAQSDEQETDLNAEQNNNEDNQLA